MKTGIDDLMAEIELDDQRQVTIQWMRNELWAFLRRPDDMSALVKLLENYRRDWICSAYNKQERAKALGGSSS